MKIFAMVPARIGSERLRQKNLEDLGGLPIVAHALRNARKANVFDEVFLNGDDPIFEKVAKDNSAKFYLRDKALGTSETRSDDVVFDFINNNKCDAVVWVNSASPLQTSDDIAKACKYFLENSLDSLITVQKMYRHALLDDKPINFRMNEQLEKTQNLTPVVLLNYAVMCWKTDVFSREYKKNGFALFCGKFGTFESSELASVLLKKRSDLELIRAIYETEKWKQTE